MRVKRRRLVLFGAAAVVGVAGLLSQRVLEAAVALPAAPSLSILALGDVGDPPGLLATLDRQQAVGRALEREDRRAPVDALVFLGDNFYDRGVSEGSLVERLRGNLVAPYCRFVELAGPLSDALRGTCPAPDTRPRPPLYAVLGNHDSQTKESRSLQTNEIEKYVSNWRMSARAAEVAELGHGVSLVLFDSNLLQGGRGDPAPLRDALRAARGPWRILAAHHPIGTSRDEQPDGDRGLGDYGERVMQAIREADVEVHVMLAGHEHNLQLVRVDPPGPRLVVVSGAGARPRKVASHSRARLFKHDGLGFARVDLVRDAFGERLAVTLYDAPHWSSLLGFGPEVVARWSVVRGGGQLLREPIAVRSAGFL